jgi:hypothetical protein
LSLAGLAASAQTAITSGRIFRLDIDNSFRVSMKGIVKDIS